MDAALRPDGAEPLGLWLGPGPPLAAYPDLRVQAFEYSSGGDRVPGRLLLPPEGEGPFPLVLLQHGAKGSKDEAYIDVAAGPWVRGGAAVACIDFPLHGERRNAKLTERLIGTLGLEGGVPGAHGPELLAAFLRQAIRDLGRALDVAATLPFLDAQRIAYASFSLGSLVGTGFCAADPRPCAAALALGGGGFGWPELDPLDTVARIAPRPTLFVNATRDETIPRVATEKLFAAAGEPKELLWFDAGHTDIPGQALKAMWLFLRRHVGLEPA